MRGLSGPMLITSSVQVPTGLSPQKWTDRKGHASNLCPRVSRGLGNNKVDLVPDGEVRITMMLPLGT